MIIKKKNNFKLYRNILILNKYIMLLEMDKLK